jgi:hypothetical protein
VQLLEDLHAQDAQHVLTGPRHGEEGRAGEDRAEQEQSDHDQDQAEQAFDALVGLVMAAGSMVSNPPRV